MQTCGAMTSLLNSKLAQQLQTWRMRLAGVGNFGCGGQNHAAGRCQGCSHVMQDHKHGEPAMLVFLQDMTVPFAAPMLPGLSSSPAAHTQQTMLQAEDSSITKWSVTCSNA